MNEQTKLYLEWLSIKSADKNKYKDILNREKQNKLTEEDIRLVQKLESCFL
jgi:hypothetical protein